MSWIGEIGRRVGLKLRWLATVRVQIPHPVLFNKGDGTARGGHLCSKQKNRRVQFSYPPFSLKIKVKKICDNKNVFRININSNKGDGAARGGRLTCNQETRWVQFPYPPFSLKIKAKLL